MFLIALVNFISTVAPTTSFWDCGEYIAASKSLGVPHPPGAPLYLLIGRLFAMLPLAQDYGLRVNLVSVLLSAFTVLLLYLSIVRLARSWRGIEATVTDKITVYGSGAVGALAFAFSHSFWFNAVEAEVYAVSMFFTALVFYLALLWLDHADMPLGNRILLFIFYLVGLSSGVHLLNILALMSVVYIISFKKSENATTSNFFLTGFIGAGIILAVYPGIIQGVPFLIKKFGIEIIVAIFVLLLVASVYFIKNDMRLPAFASLSVILVLVGYSTFLLIKIRSGQNPFLDENNPETWSGLLSYINREQYGSESLFLTMFERKAPFWTYQIKKMYLRYLDWQYFEASRFLALPFLLGMIGAVHHFFRDKKAAFTVLVLFFMTGMAILLYLNQDDPQPRERDYAYVGSFFAFAIWIGIGAIALVEMALEKMRKWSSKMIAGTISTVCIAVVPLNMWIQNYDSHDRSGNYVAWDYSYNLLMTCEENAILYTNGDNDTFPLWYLQVVDNVRPDVRVVNLSLLNTGWFIKQLRDKEPKVPTPAKFTDDYIENVLESREYEALMERIWLEKRKVSIDGPTADSPKLIWDVPATVSVPMGREGQLAHFLRVQDWSILNTIAVNKWEHPIYFAVTVSDGNLLGLRNIYDQNQNYLTMEGLAFKLSPVPVDLISPEKMADNLLKLYRYRNLNNPDVYFDSNIIKLLGNYRQAIVQLSFHYLSESRLTGNMDETGSDLTIDERVEMFNDLPPRVKALTTLEFIDDRIPEELIPSTHDIIPMQMGRLYAQLGKPEEMAKRLNRVIESNPLNAQTAYDFGYYFLSDASSPEQAQYLFNMSLDSNRSLENYQRIALTWLQFSKDSTYASDVLKRYISENQNQSAKIRVASLAYAMGLDDLTYSIYSTMKKDDPNNRLAVQGLTEFYQRRGDNARAIELMDEWLAKFPADKDMFEKLNQLKSIDSSRASLDRLLGKTTSDSAISKQLGNLRSVAGKDT